MIESRNAAAWRMLCLRWRSPGHWFEEAVMHTDRPAFDHLVAIKAIKPFVADNRYVLCSHCGLHTAEVYRQAGSMELNCPECGPVQVMPEQFKAWVVDAEWLIRKLRAALAIPAQDATVAITRDVWRLGQYQRRPVFLASSLDAVLHHPSVMVRARGAATPWLIALKPLHDIDADPLPGSATWLPMEERFTLFGGNLGIFDPATPEVAISDATEAAHGPFSQDFRWVHLADAPGNPIALSDGQAAVFAALWHFASQAQEAHTIMARAGLTSDKPIDVFKVKSENKGDPKYERPLRAYKLLVQTNRRAGTYAMPCAATMPA